MSDVNIFEILSSKPHNSHYLNRYWKFIQYCSRVNANKTLLELGYVEVHHICPKERELFPKYMNFREFEWNKIILTYEQHLIAHHILAKTYGGGQFLAFNLMFDTRGPGKVKSLKVLSALRIAGNIANRLAHLGKKDSQATIERKRAASTGKLHTEETKLQIATTLTGAKHDEERVQKNSESHKGLPSPMKGKRHTEESKEKNRQSCKGRESSMKGKRHTEESKEKNRQSKLGQTHTEETKRKISEALIGRDCKDSTRELLRIANIGRVHDQSTIDKISENRKGKGTGVRGTAECPHCGLNGGAGALKRYHFDNCKENPNRIDTVDNVIVKCPHCDKIGNGVAMKRWHFDNCRHIAIVV